MVKFVKGVLRNDASWSIYFEIHHVFHPINFQLSWATFFNYFTYDALLQNERITFHCVCIFHDSHTKIEVHIVA